ncbi:Putative cysteine-rich repeat secretory protein 7 [Apostasia shenzhenica]|uniref:Cysteine-rich repeat secretory protein 7 n=1 Tax=Apostasia shenzhenica TaxID=1088818 RepID=A0A2I0APY6_9ASPA|nr:Putative cysteine-rich repeat secretory protein 7 [Apostasia shenzhenica]
MGYMSLRLVLIKATAFLLLLLLLLLLVPIATSNDCNIQTIAEQNDPGLRERIQAAVAAVTVNIVEYRNLNGFAKITILDKTIKDTPPNNVYALGWCRRTGDPATCKRCVLNLSARIMNQNNCPLNTRRLVFGDSICFMRYQTAFKFFDDPNTIYFKADHSPGVVRSIWPGDFESKVRAVFEPLISGPIFPYQLKNYYFTAKKLITLWQGFHAKSVVEVQVTVQCAEAMLFQSSCRKCLSVALDQVSKGCRGGRQWCYVFSGRCFLKYSATPV